MYYNRKTATVEPDTKDDSLFLSFLYHTIIGRIVLWAIVARPWFTKFVSNYQKSQLSHKAIAPFIRKNKINIDEKFALNQYKTFNDFFTRCQEVKNNSFPNELVSPAESRMRFYTIDDNLVLNIKNSRYNIADILDDKEMAQRFAGGTCIVFRLCVNNYHRYHFIDNGKIIFNKKIPGELHTVRPISEKYNVFTRNAREVTVMETENFGTIAQIEIGALMVGKIINHNVKEFNRMEEKGYFEFGGSTIVLLLNKEIDFDQDIKYANDDCEIKVCAGEKIGKIIES